MSSFDIIRTTSSLGLSSSLILSGMYFSSSQLTLPILYRLPDATSTDIFQELYYRGAATVVPLCAFSTLSSGAAAYYDSMRRRGFVSAAVLTFASMPWTLLVMKSGIDRLLKLHESSVEREKAEKGEVERLLRTWKWMNVVRGAFCAAGGAVGLVALLDGL